MQELNLNLEPINPARLIISQKSPTLRDGAAIVFRHFRLMAVSFLLVFAGAVAVTSLIPPRYDSHIKIFVKRERLDQIVSPDQNQQVFPREVSETDLNSEVELLKSRDLLQKVVMETGLANSSKPSFTSGILAKLGLRRKANVAEQDLATLDAVRALEKDLSVDLIRKTNLIQVSYGSKDPYQSVKVLQALVRAYLEKHLEVHRLPGALDFFQNQTREYRQSLTDAEQKIVDFGNASGVVAAPLEKEMTVRKLNDFEAQLDGTQAAIKETDERIKVLEEQAVATPARLTTQVKTADNQALLQQLKSTLLTLELKRTELLGKFEPDYRPVQEVEAQISQTKEALTNAERNPVREEVTDRDTTHQWIVGELAKARAERSTLQTRVLELTQTVETYRARARQLNQNEVTQENLVRSAKTAEANFLLYSRKQEEARISDALDQERIVNVSIAEDATAAAKPSSPNWPLSLAAGLALAGLISVGSAVLVDCLDRSFRTPFEVEAFLDIPVLAALPKNRVLSRGKT